MTNHREPSHWPFSVKLSLCMMLYTPVTLTPRCPNAEPPATQDASKASLMLACAAQRFPVWGTIVSQLTTQSASSGKKATLDPMGHGLGSVTRESKEFQLRMQKSYTKRLGRVGKSHDVNQVLRWLKLQIRTQTAAVACPRFTGLPVRPYCKGATRPQQNSVPRQTKKGK